ncbi:cell envelope integrity protein TolA [Allosphingosinicella vermicomposti]|uniref:cell envelope integrity protein TolA n=1 Tax=Allosphingosinicella vermicomposti TaxID=614671 RepID=UPI000D0FF32B|nr:cell envelope integrity protein TolA [Allosphingosinicella vermicomposti]
MDRAEATGLGIAVVGHGALLAVLTLGLANAVVLPTMNPPMDVSFVDEVGLQSAAPDPATEAPMASIAPETGSPEEAAPKAIEAPPEPTPTVQPKALPKAKSEPAPSKTATKPAPPKALPKAATSNAKANSGKGKAEKTKGSRLGSDFLKGLGDDTKSKSNKATGAVMSAQAASSIGSLIKRQVQPCADRQGTPGPGAERITVTIKLRLNRDGSLAARPVSTGTSGVDDQNRRYEKRVEELAIAAFVGCSPLRGLPDELYDVPRGWSNFTLRYKPS